MKRFSGINFRRNVTFERNALEKQNYYLFYKFLISWKIKANFITTLFF